MRRRMAFCTVVALFGLLVLAQAVGAYSAVTDGMLRNPPPEEWLQVQRTYQRTGFSPLDQVNRGNVANLVPVWAFSTGVTEGHEGQPLVHDGIMFITAAYNRLFALDAKTGDLLWKYERRLPQDVFPVVCCDVVNRGVALYGDKVYMGTLDAHVLAFDARTGRIVWDQTIANYKEGYVITSPPIAARGKIIVGHHGGEFGVRGFLVALDAETGRTVWKTYTVPGPGERGNESWTGDGWRRGGAAPWGIGSYDPELNLVYWTTGNPAPWMAEARGPGDHLYSNSVIAVDADTGQLKAHFQFTPADSWDWDAVGENVLVDLPIDGRTVKAALHADKNGYFYVLDRTNLGFIKATPFTYNNVFTGIDPRTGRPTFDPERTPGLGKQVFACPAFHGGKNWSSTAYNPQTGYLYIPSNEWCMDLKGVQVNYVAGQPFIGAEFLKVPVPGLDHVGKLQAVDPATGKQVWAHKMEIPIWGGVLTTAGGLVFYGAPDRYLRAYDAATGKVLWQFRTSSGIVGTPMTYMIDGVQYVAVLSGWGGEVSMVPGPVTQRVKDVPKGGSVWVFALNR